MNKVLARNASLSSQIVEILTEQIRDGAYPPGTLLPTENQLVHEFKVSRATVRSAFDRLDAMGLIIRQQGVGTFVHKLSSISNPLNKFLTFRELIRDNGYEPDFQQLHAELIEPSPEITDNLILEAGTPVLRVHKVFLADGDPIIFCINHFPAWVFQDVFTSEEVIQPGITEPLFEFLEQKCNQRIRYYVSSVRADILKFCHLPNVFDKMGAYTPILIIDDIGYDEGDRPVHQSIEFHPGNRMKFQLIRSR